jgi:hypothetical protein
MRILRDRAQANLRAAISAHCRTAVFDRERKASRLKPLLRRIA